MAKGVSEGGAAFLQGLKAVATEGWKIGKGTAGVGGNIVSGTASAGTGLVSRVLGGAGSFMKAHPKISFLAGLYGALKGVQHIFRKRGEKQALQESAAQAVQFQPYGAQPEYAQQAGYGYAPPQFDAPQQATTAEDFSQAQLAQQVLEAISTAQQRQGGAPQSSVPQASFAERVHPNGAARPAANQWTQTVDSSRYQSGSGRSPG